MDNTVLSLPAAPGDNGVAILWDSTADPATGTTAKRRGFGMLFSRAIVNLTINQNSAAAGFKVQYSDDGGTTWVTFNAGGSGEQFLAATADYNRDVKLVGGKDYRITYTDGATGSTTWRGSVTLVRGDRSAGT